MGRFWLSAKAQALVAANGVLPRLGACEIMHERNVSCALSKQRHSVPAHWWPESRIAHRRWHVKVSWPESQRTVQPPKPPMARWHGMLRFCTAWCRSEPLVDHSAALRPAPHQECRGTAALTQPLAAETTGRTSGNNSIKDGSRSFAGLSTRTATAAAARRRVFAISLRDLESTKYFRN